MVKTYLTPAIGALVAAMATPAFANGLAINEQNASSAGTSYAGRASTPRDASTIYGNPAGLSRLQRTQVSVGAAFIKAKSDIHDVISSTAGTNEGDMVPNTTVPFAYFAQPINDKWAWGVGLYAPFGVKDNYEDSFSGRAYGLDSEVTVTTLQPTISYKINDRVSLGFGPTINRIEGKLTNSIPNRYLGIPLSGETAVDVKGDDVALGYNAGLLVAVADNLDWGITYHSKVNYDLSGHTNISTALPGATGRYDGALSITLPESVDTSFTYRLNDWGFYLGATWTHWSRLSSINVKNKNAGPFSSVSEELNWHDTLTYAFGTSYNLNGKWQLRAGFATDPSPTSNADRTVRIPVGNRHGFTLGAGWQATSDLTVDMVYGHIWESWSQVNASKYGTYRANYRNTANSVAAQLTYKF